MNAQIKVNLSKIEIEDHKSRMTLDLNKEGLKKLLLGLRQYKKQREFSLNLGTRGYVLIKHIDKDTCEVFMFNGEAAAESVVEKRKFKKAAKKSMRYLL